MKHLLFILLLVTTSLVSCKKETSESNPYKVRSFDHPTFELISATRFFVGEEETSTNNRSWKLYDFTEDHVLDLVAPEGVHPRIVERNLFHLNFMLETGDQVLPDFVVVEPEIFYSQNPADQGVFTRNYWKLFNRDFCSSSCNVSAIAEQVEITFNEADSLPASPVDQNKLDLILTSDEINYPTKAVFVAYR